MELPAVNVLSKIDLITKFGDIDYDLEYFTELPDLSLMLYGVDRGLPSPAEEDGMEESEQERESEVQMNENESKMNEKMNENESKMNENESKMNENESKMNENESKMNENDDSFTHSDAESSTSDVCEEEEFVRRARTPFQRKYRKLYWMLCEIVNDYSLLSFLPLDINVLYGEE